MNKAHLSQLYNFYLLQYLSYDKLLSNYRESNKNSLKIQEYIKSSSKQQKNDFVIILLNLTLMIQYGNIRYCLNPQCTSHDRKIHDYRQIGAQHKKNCKKWIFNPDDLINSSPQSLFNQDIRLRVKKEPIKAIIDIYKIEDWQTKIQKLFNDFRQAIMDKIQQLQNKFSHYFKQLKQKSQKAVKELNQFIKNIEKIPSQSYTNILPNLIEFSTRTNIYIHGNHSIGKYYSQKIIPCLNQFCDHIISFDQSENMLEIRRQIAKNKLDQFIENPQILLNQKIQTLSKLSKTQLSRAKFQEATGCYRINCWICQISLKGPKVNMNTPKKQEIQGVTPRQYIYKILLQHIKQKHSQQIQLVYMTRFLRSHISEISIPQMIKSIKNQSNSLQSIWVIDRQNSGTFEMPDKYIFGSSTKKRLFYIDVVNKENKNLAKSPYLVADSCKKDAADILIGLIIYQLAKQTSVKIFLVTNDHFGSALQDIINNLFGKKFQRLKVCQAIKKI